MTDKLITHTDSVFSIDDFWDQELCETIIHQAEKDNYFPQKETVLQQNTLEDNLESRGDFRVYLENQEVADLIYEHLKEYLNCIDLPLFTPSGIHSDLRIYKYLPGQEFKRHRDGKTVVSDSEESIFSLLIYLNDNFSGGNTRFDDCEIQPKQGRVTFFPHTMLHSGEVVTQGFKYVLRGNILFKRN